MVTGRLQVTLFVSDVLKSVDYYRNVLGFEFNGYWNPKTQGVEQEWGHDEPPEYAEVLAGENRIGLRPAQGPVQPGAVECSLEVTGIDHLHEQVRVRGGQATLPADQPWGARTFTTSDPDGHLWLFLESK